MNSAADPGEVVDLRIKLTNNNSIDSVTDVSATLEVSFGGVPVSTGMSEYPDIGPLGFGENEMPFLVPISQRLASACGGQFSLRLKVNSFGNDPVILYWSLRVGKNKAGIHEDTAVVGEPGMSKPQLMPRPEGFGLFYLTTRGELRYQVLGAFGETGLTATLGSLDRSRSDRYAVATTGTGYAAVYRNRDALPMQLYSRRVGFATGPISTPIALQSGGFPLNGFDPALAWSEEAQQFGLAYREQDANELRFVRLDDIGNVVSAPIVLSTGVTMSGPMQMVRVPGALPGQGQYVVVWESFLPSGQLGKTGVAYTRIDESTGDPVTGETEVVLRDPNAPGNTGGLAVVAAADGSVGVFWDDTRHDPSFVDCFPGDGSCLQQIYYRRIKAPAEGGMDDEIRVSLPDPNTSLLADAEQPSAVGLEDGKFQVAWLDQRLDPSGLCQLHCDPAVFQIRMSPDGTRYDKDNHPCDQGCDEEAWKTLPIGLNPPVLGHSELKTGYILDAIVAGNGLVPRVLGIRTLIGEFDFFKKDPGTNPTINETGLILPGSLGRENGTVLAAWAETGGFPVDPALKVRRIGATVLEAPLRILPETGCDTDPNGVGCGLAPGAVSEPIPIPGGGVVSFLHLHVTEQKDVYIAGFADDGEPLFEPRKVNDTDGRWDQSEVAVLGNRLGVVYQNSATRTVRFRTFDLDGNNPSSDEILSADATTPSITTLTDRFAIGLVEGSPSHALLKFRDGFGSLIGSDISLTPPMVKSAELDVAGVDDEIGVLYVLPDAQRLVFEVLDTGGNRIVNDVTLDTVFVGLTHLVFTGNDFLASWAGIGLRWRLLGFQNQLNTETKPIGFIPDATVNGIASHTDGYQIAFAISGSGQTRGMFLSQFQPPQEGVVCGLYNTEPSVNAIAIDPNHPGPPNQVALGSTIILQASATSGANNTMNPGDNQLSFAWDLNGDGQDDFDVQSVTLDPNDLAGFGIDTAGSFTIRLTVTDSRGASKTFFLDLEVKDVTRPTVRVVSPNGGESWPVGSSQVITWEASDDVGVNHFDIYYATDFNGNTGTWHLIATEPGSKSSHDLGSVPGPLSATARIKVVAVDNGNNSAEDISDANLYFIQATTAAVKTLIVTHLGRLNTLYPGSSGAMLSKLNELAIRDSVSGVILLLDNVPAVNTALNAWDAAHASNPATSQDEALAAAKAIHDYLWAPGTGQASSVFTQAKYVVLVGEDKVVPFYRAKDSTGVLPESSYTELSATGTVGAALKASAGAPGGYFLSDDYYGAGEAQLTEVGAGELWLPSLAVGRLVQTPAEIATQVNRFIAQDGEVKASDGLVSGYDFVLDGAEDIAAQLSGGGVGVDDTLIGQLWTPASLKCRLLGQAGCAVRPELVALNGHANHYQLGSAQGVVNATELASLTQTLAGAVVWGMGCHSGLVVPESETKPLDVVQALNRLGVVAQVGQSGFGWGFRHGVGLTEELMREYSERLVEAPTVAVGDALVKAKTSYFLSAYRYDVFDEKVLQEAVLYGLPMYSVVNAEPRLARSEPRFAVSEADGKVKRGGVTRQKSTRALPGGVTLLALDFEFGAETLHRVDTEDGSYYELNGLTTSEIGNPLEPMFVHNSTLSSTEFRGVLFTGGEYTDETGFDPTVGAPASNNEDRGEGPLPNATTFLPSIGRTGSGGSGGRGSIRGTEQGAPGEARLMVSVGHYLGGQRHRLFNAMNFEMYYSTGTDRIVPQIVDPGPTAVLHEDTATGLHFTATATDNVKLYRVLITYSTEQGQWNSLDLVREGSTSQWSADLDGVHDALYLVQVIDTSGNSSYLAKPTNDLDAAGHPWGTESAGPRLFVAGDIATVVGHGAAELWWSLAGLLLLGVLSVTRRQRVDSAAVG